METHTVLGEQLLRGVSLPARVGARGRPLAPRALGRARLPGRAFAARRSRSAARIFAVADALDAMTSDRPYRRAMSWAGRGPRDLEPQSGRQFDPAVVEAFRSRERSLRRVRRQLEEAALVAWAEDVGGGGRTSALDSAWCQSTIFLHRPGRSRSRDRPGPSQRLCCRSPSTEGRPHRSGRGS